jgi:uncharacterized protein
VNANPASLDYLVPTVVTVTGVPAASVTYPAGQIFRPKFSPEGISIYEGSVEIKAELQKGALASATREPLQVEVQACTVQICLPPATLTTSIIQ